MPSKRNKSARQANLRLPHLDKKGICTFELVRLPSLESQGQNPWRISRQELELKWEKGNLVVMTMGAAAAEPKV